MNFKDFQAPVLFSSTFKALNLGEKNQVLSRTFKDAWEPCDHLEQSTACTTSTRAVTECLHTCTEDAPVLDHPALVRRFTQFWCQI